MLRNWINFPELTNRELEIYYFESPHRQITEDFRAKVVKVHDGDTITLQWPERNFTFPLRLLYINSPELSEPGGKDSQSWLEERILDEEVDVLINRNNRVDKWGRLLGVVFFRGLSVNDELVWHGKAAAFAQKDEGKLPILGKELNIKQWL